MSKVLIDQIKLTELLENEYSSVSEGQAGYLKKLMHSIDYSHPVPSSIVALGSLSKKNASFIIAEIIAAKDKESDKANLVAAKLGTTKAPASEVSFSTSRDVKDYFTTHSATLEDIKNQVLNIARGNNPVKGTSMKRYSVQSKRFLRDRITRLTQSMTATLSGAVTLERYYFPDIQDPLKSLRNLLPNLISESERHTRYLNLEGSCREHQEEAVKFATQGIDEVLLLLGKIISHS